MSSTFRFMALAVALGLVAGACSENTTPTVASDAGLETVSTFAHNFGNGPGSPGMSGVFRGQDVFVTFTTDPRRDLLAAHFQADDIFFCGGGSSFELSDFQAVNNQEDIFRVVTQLVDAPIFLYELSTFTGTCAEFANGWLYQGTHSMIVRDNDISGQAPGANSFAWQGHGTVEDPGGGIHQYSETQTALFFFPDGPFRFINENIRVTKKGH